MTKTPSREADLLTTKEIKLRCKKYAKQAELVEKRQKKSKAVPISKQAQWVLLKRCYQLTTLCADAKSMKRLRAAVPSDCRPRGRLAELRSAWILSLVFSQMGPVTKAVRNKIRQRAYALDLALEKKVPSRFLAGFIYQEGGLTAIEQIYVAKFRG